MTFPPVALPGSPYVLVSHAAGGLHEQGSPAEAARRRQRRWHTAGAAGSRRRRRRRPKAAPPLQAAARHRGAIAAPGGERGDTSRPTAAVTVGGDGGWGVARCDANRRRIAAPSRRGRRPGGRELRGGCAGCGAGHPPWPSCSIQHRLHVPTPQARPGQAKRQQPRGEQSCARGPLGLHGRAAGSSVSDHQHGHVPAALTQVSFHLALPVDMQGRGRGAAAQPRRAATLDIESVKNLHQQRQAERERQLKVRRGCKQRLQRCIDSLDAASSSCFCCCSAPRLQLLAGTSAA